MAALAFVVAAVVIAAAFTSGCAGNELRVSESSSDARAAAGSRASSSTTAPPPPTTTTTAPPPTTTTTEPPPTTSPPTTDPPPPADQSLAGQSLSFVNRKRAENGLGALSTDPDLTAAAEGWAQELVRSQELGHNPNLGDAVPDHFHTWGENVAYSSNAGDIDMMWWNSEGHRNNILGSSYTSIGIAFIEDADGVTWAVQVFAG